MKESMATLELLAQHEMAMMDFYEALARAFPDRAQLWRDIAAQEQVHADTLLELAAEEPLLVSVAYKDFKPQAVRTSIVWIEEKTALAREGKLSIIQALALSGDLESALLEGNFFKAGVSAPPPIMPILLRLSEETRDHLRVFSEALDAEKTKRRNG